MKEREFDFPIKFVERAHSVKTGLMGSEYRKVKYLASGSNSVVFTGRRNHSMVVIKMLKQDLNNWITAESEMGLEFELLCKLNHPHIIHIKGAGLFPRMFVELEYLEGGTLDRFLKCRPQVDLKQALSIAKNLASALKYLHDEFHPDATIIHRDLKPQNIGFTADGQLKLFDFGLVACVQRRCHSSQAYAMTVCTGTLAYMAPEVAQRQPYNEKVDVYSFGILLWQLLSGATPFEGMAREEYMEKVVKGGLRPSLEELAHARRGGPWDSLPVRQLAEEVLQSCWHVNPRSRPNIRKICELLDELSQRCDAVERTPMIARDVPASAVPEEVLSIDDEEVKCGPSKGERAVLSLRLSF